MNIKTAAIILLLCFFIGVLPVSAETVWVRTNTENVWVTVSSSGGVVGSGRADYDSTIGAHAILVEVPPGTYTIRGEREDYGTRTITVNVVAGQQPQIVDLTLSADTTAHGTMILESIPCGAEISYSDATKTVMGTGRTVQAAPGAECVFQVNVPPGTYEVSASLPGYVKQTSSYIVDPRRSLEHLVFHLEPAPVTETTHPWSVYALMSLDVNPRTSDVQVCVTGRDGSTNCHPLGRVLPADFSVSQDEYVEITASADGYITQTVKAHNPGEGGRAITITLSPVGTTQTPEETHPEGQKSSPFTEATTKPTDTVTPARTLLPLAGGTTSPGRDQLIQTTITPERTIEKVITPAETVTPTVTVPSPGTDVIGGILRFFNGLFGGR